jgi:DNA modification methylase
MSQSFYRSLDTRPPSRARPTCNRDKSEKTFLFKNRGCFGFARIFYISKHPLSSYMYKENLRIEYVPVTSLNPSEYNPRKWDGESKLQLKESITRFGIADPLIVNGAENRKNILIGGHFRLQVLKELGHEQVPVVYLNIPEIEKEKELNLRLNRNLGEFDIDLLSEFDEAFLIDVGFTSEELDDIFPAEEDAEEEVDIEKQLAEMEIHGVDVKLGDIYELNGSRLMCGNSMIEEDVLALMENTKADLCMTDPPYLLAYLDPKNKNRLSEGFGAKQNRRYEGTDVLPENFTELWIGNVAKVAKDNFHIIVYENWKNIRTIWDEMEKYWKVKNMLVWHTTNRSQGYPSKYKFLSKHDIAMVGSTEEQESLNIEDEGELLDNEYETALYAMSGKPQWEGYGAGRRFQPTDFMEHPVANKKSSGQSLVFGTKPLEILIPYIKVLTKRGDLVLEPFGGSGSTLLASLKMERRCYIMEKNPTYAQVILKRWENLTGEKALKIHEKLER